MLTRSQVCQITGIDRQKIWRYHNKGIIQGFTLVTTYPTLFTLENLLEIWLVELMRKELTFKQSLERLNEIKIMKIDRFPEKRFKIYSKVVLWDNTPNLELILDKFGGKFILETSKSELVRDLKDKAIEHGLNTEIFDFPDLELETVRELNRFKS